MKTVFLRLLITKLFSAAFAGIRIVIFGNESTKYLKVYLLNKFRDIFWVGAICMTSLDKNRPKGLKIRTKRDASGKKGKSTCQLTF